MTSLCLQLCFHGFGGSVFTLGVDSCGGVGRLCLRVCVLLLAAGE